MCLLIDAIAIAAVVFWLFTRK